MYLKAVNVLRNEVLLSDVDDKGNDISFIRLLQNIIFVGFRQVYSLILFVRI